MGGEAQIWQPRTTLALSADTKRIRQGFTAGTNQTLFTLTNFSYELNTGALQIFKENTLGDKVYLELGIDWVEGTTTTFSLVVPALAGERIVAVGYSGITGAVDVRDTDIFIANYQAIRDYAGTELNLYAQSDTVVGDDGESWWQKRTGAAPGTYVDNGINVLRPTGGDGSIGWQRAGAETNSYAPAGDGLLTSVQIHLVSNHWRNIAEYGLITPGMDLTALIIAAVADVTCPKLQLPAGVYVISAAIVISRAFTLHGAGSCSAAENNATGQPGSSTTRLNFTGTNINGFELGSTANEGVENIHLADLSLWGTVTMNDGIQLGTPIGGGGVGLTKSSLTNVHVRGFTKVGKFGIRCVSVLTTAFHNVYTQFNYYGWGNLNGDICTTMRSTSITSRTNIINGVFIGGQWSGCSMAGVLNEGNGKEGMVMNPSVTGVQTASAFYSYYSEGNNDVGAGPGGGVAPVVIGNGTQEASEITFYAGKIEDQGSFGGKSVHLDRADKVLFDNTEFGTYNAGFIEVTANTNQCQFRTLVPSILDTDVTGNAAVSGISRLTVLDGHPKIKTGIITYDISTVSGTVPEIGLGFTPKYVQAYAVVPGASLMSMGFADADNIVNVTDNHGQAADTWADDAASAVQLKVDNSNHARGSIGTFILDGFSIVWTKTGAPTGVAKIYYTAHG